MAPRHAPSRRRRRVATVALCPLAVLVASCGGGGSGTSAERFCGEIDEHREQLTDPAIATEADIAPLLDLYREIADLAPLSIEQEWRQLITAYETASTVVPGDADSEQAALAVIYSSEESAAAVSQWLQENCAVDIGPVATIVPHD